MDRTDKKILDILQSNCQINNQELAEMVALSPSPCLRRVKLLEDNGYIKKKVALLEPEKIGLKLSVIVLVGLNSHQPAVMNQFEEAVRFLPEIVQCYLITGQSADYVLKVIVPDLNAYQSFLLDKLTRINGVTSVQSSFILRTICETTTLPLDHLD
ncbi:TPA: Lrp/AsnC family transcriptional regulator [Legionella anisa]|uniref:Lrp/AsnC family transcriptional regulator n=1 Tax=Legionella anisa TaxID=28082 RepID=A0AAX0WY13_9GAMM|nr:Lrp/AsnC family transcriptional regulator [Legionella anisa]AWN75831.1 Lrp/AsnC family transcriptional regulator [Legionella anisa]MBN5936522.1 Lrp/AsnC family transcriptional regulator [Legionella anisa]MCW8424845.1 Lrp/AsnC family transcriptional regulator [Legionella anisa]MCW8446036.1 Lrp/AsnC family transcriptional regulator [Legionella anisa]PNL63458.1 Lrp/AsnC family transcriptional regulator [Legionella anisa]